MSRYTESGEGAAAVNALHRKYNTKRRYTAAEFEAIVKAVNPDDCAIIIPVRERNTFVFMEMLDSMLHATIPSDAKDLMVAQQRCKDFQVVGKFLLDIWNRVEKRTTPMSGYSAKKRWRQAI